VQLAREVGARVIGTGRAQDRGWAGELGVDTFLDLEAERLEDAGEVDVVFDMIGGDVSPVRRRWSAPAARSSPSPSRRRPSRATGVHFSSLSKPIWPAWPASPRGYGMDASSRWWGRCCRSLKLPRHSLPISASLARRSCV
jgi:hypothetical protein